MAVATPTPPTPPAPPTVPQVKLQEKGSATESSVPSKGKDQSPEAQARSSVAQGNGSLSKTTTTNPNDNEQKAQQSDSNNQAPQPAASTQPPESNQSVTQVPPLMDANDLLTDRSNAKNQSQQATAASYTQYDDAVSSSGHGSFYVAFSIVALVVLTVAAFTFMQKKKASRGSSSVTAKKPKPKLDLTGQTSEEVMKALQAQHMARAKAGYAPQQSNGTPVSAAAANQYLSQSKQKPDKSHKQSPPITDKPRTIRRNQKSDKDETHFEVRI